MKLFKILYLLVGLGLLSLILANTDLASVSRSIIAMGWGILIVMAIYFVEFVLDSVAWALTFPSRKLNAQWLCQTWKLRMIGEAFNAVIPMATMGGEPLKAQLLKEHHEIAYRESIASMILIKTCSMLTLAVFLSGGFLLMFWHPKLSHAYKMVGSVGLAVFAASILFLFLVQRMRLSSLALQKWFGQGRFEHWVERLVELDQRLIDFYKHRPRDFSGACFLALSSWFLGILELYLTFIYLGHPVSLGDAWMIEALAQLVRIGTFFIPLSIGAQEAAFFMICASLTGSPDLGFAVAMTRRFREVVWILWGFMLAWKKTF